MSMAEIHNMLTSLMRNIDRRTVLTVEPGNDPNRPAVMVRLSRDRRSGSLQLREADLVPGQTDLMYRNRIRTALKRAHDRMWEQTNTVILPKKLERRKPEGGQGWRQPMSRGRGRR